MRFNIHKCKDITQWHRWFAWHPVEIDGVYVWLETVEVRCDMHYCQAGTIYSWEARFSDRKA